MMGTAHVDRNSRYALTALVVILAFLAMARLAVLTAMSPMTVIALIWILTVPISYRALAEESPPSRGLLELPGPPTGLSWQTPHPRRKGNFRTSVHEREARELRRSLNVLGYSHAPADDARVDLVARSPDGRSMVVKICDRQAGVLACQDAMKAMLNMHVDEAVVLSAHGSTPTAKRFVREIRSRKGVRIRIWSQPNFEKLRWVDARATSLLGKKE